MGQVSSFLKTIERVSMLVPVIVQSLSCIQLFETTWTAASRAPPSSIISWSLLKFMSTESVMLLNHLILCYTLLLLPSIFPSIMVFSNESNAFPMLFASGGQSIGASASASVLPMNIQGWFPSELTGLIFLLSKDSQESTPAPQLESISSSVFSLLYSPTLTSIHDYWKNHSFV